jgi:hypothetical protein
MIPYPCRVPPSSIVVNRVSASLFASGLPGEQGYASAEAARPGRHAMVALGLAYTPGGACRAKRRRTAAPGHMTRVPGEPA